MRAVALFRDEAEERAARIDQLLEELRLNTADLHELARQAFVRAQMAVHEARQTTFESQQQRKARRKPQK